MNREKRLTKREQKALKPVRAGAAQAGAQAQHIHCVACGRHIDAGEFNPPAQAVLIRCAHGKQFPSCVGCRPTSQALIDQHDRTGQDVHTAAAWH